MTVRITREHDSLGRISDSFIFPSLHLIVLRYSACFYRAVSPGVFLQRALLIQEEKTVFGKVKKQVVKFGLVSHLCLLMHELVWGTCRYL